MSILLFLILFPLLIGTILLFVKHRKIRQFITVVSSILIGLGSISLLGLYLIDDQMGFAVHSPIPGLLIFLVELVITVYLIYTTIKHRQYLSFSLIITSFFFITLFEHFFGHEIQVYHPLFYDQLSIIMALIIGIIGSIICVYSLSYMSHFHQDHPEVPDRSRFFFAFLFIFLSAMFGLVFSNNMLWFYCFWEITTLCSFLLIGYKQNDESVRNAFNALQMNMVGGLMFVLGIVFMFYFTGSVELDRLISSHSVFVLIPVALFSIAGLTKSAQMPFSSWLLGAMVAPTPVSALLHSSTMVKAGVYLIVKLSPLLSGNIFGLLVALIGGITFLLTSFIAVSQRDAKKILAYSTVANLGLIVACAGVGNHQAVWAAIMLIIFHAIAKCLLFLCVGSVEGASGSRNVEDMDGLIIRYPKLAAMMLIGMAGMFVAPFGMLISKWAVLETFIKSSPILAFLIIFGSAPTMFFWVKWMGKLLMVSDEVNTNKQFGALELIPLKLLSALVFVICAGFPLVSSFFVTPYLLHLYGVSVQLSHGNVVIMLLMLLLILLFPIALYHNQIQRRYQLTSPYLAGANVTATSFYGSFGQTHPIVAQNYYLDQYCNEKKLCGISVVLTNILLGLIGIMTIILGVLSLWYLC